MPWYFPWSDSIKKRACRYLLQRYLGHFLKEKLTLDQLSLDLYNGKGTMKDLLLDVVSLNEALDSYNVPFEIVDGFIGNMTVDIPWSALVNANTHVAVHNLELTIQPKQRDDRAGVMLESMLNSMTSSLELAQECLRQDTTEGEQHAETAQPFEGLEMFAMTIEAVLSRIKMTFTDTVIRLEHLPKDSKSGAALELRIARIEYFDDIANDPGSSVDQPGGASDGKQIYEVPAVAHKNIHVMGATLYCDEFPATHRTVSRVISMDTSATKEANSSSPCISPPFHLNLDEKSPDQGSEVKDSDPIKIAVLMGKQELKLKIKQNEELLGPKMEMDAHLGIMNIHLSPRQVHLLLLIANGLTAPDQCDNTKMRARRAMNRPMDTEDEEKVEQELQKRLLSDRLMRYGSPHWDSEDVFANQCLDDSEEEMYFDLDNQSVSMSMTSSMSSTSTARSASTTSSYNYPRRDAPFQNTLPRTGRSKPKSKHKDSLHKLLDDTASALAKYKLRISFLSAVILHEDPPSTPGDALDPGQTSLEKLRLMADKYFSRVCSVNTSGVSTTLTTLRMEFSKACGVDHISILGKPLMLECTQKCSSTAMTTEAEVTIGLAEVVEALYDHRGATAATASLLGIHIPLEEILPEYCELVTFPEDDTPKAPSMFSSMHTSSGPCIRLKATTAQRTHHSPRRHSTSSSPKTEIHLELAKFISEVDISLVDRIHAILNPQPLTKTAGSVYVSAYKSFHSVTQSQQVVFTQTLDDTPAPSDRPLDFRLTCHNSTLIIRFPVPDLRHGQGVDKPWWRRRLHPERLLLHIVDGEFHTKQQGEPLSEMDFTCREMTALFQEHPDKEPVPFIYVSKADSSMQDREEGFDWPRLEIKTYPKHQSQLEQVEEEEDSLNMDSLNGACQFDPPPPSPFSRRKVLYDNDELVLPGDRQETSEFQEQSLAKTQMSLDLTLPNVNVYFISKHFFELVYNRLLNDLILWEPVAPSPLDVHDAYSFSRGPGWSLDTVTPFMQNQPPESFALCKSGAQYDSSSDDEDEGGGEFFSTHEYRSRQRQKQSPDRGGKSKLCVSLNITRGRLTASVPSKGEEGMEKPGHHGELCLEVADGTFFTVVQTNGDPELQHMCIHVHRTALYHADEVADSAAPPLTRVPPGMVPPSHLVPTMYLTESGVETSLSGQVGIGGDTQDMLSIAVQVKIDLTTNVEECIVALGVRGTTLLHRTLPTNHSWFDQLVDLLAVEEFPVLGYVKPAILTQLHAHLYSCSIDYRPLYLPYNTLVTLETFSICSNVVAESPTSKLRFRIEDGALYISQHGRSREVDLRRDYVCVADVGVFELILTTSDGKDPKYPKLDLRATNNILHIRTCSDSCRALAELINYLADNGDLVYDGNTPTSSVLLQSPSSSTLSDSPHLSQSHMEHVHDMMADAMKESLTSSQLQSKDLSPEADRKPVEVFFFPGEGAEATVSTSLPDYPDVDPPSPPDSYLPERNSDDDESDEDSVERSLSQLEGAGVLAHSQVISEGEGMFEGSGDEEVVDGDRYSGDDEFCIIDDPGLGIASRDGEPIVRVLTESPIQVVDNHFEMPLGKVDQLKPPKHFPPAMYKYTLQEMSLVWFMYGGKDFSAPKKVSSKSGAKQKLSMGKAGWQARGGPERDIDTLLELQLNKVRLQHEIYPETTDQAARQIILIHEVEIRDRLLHSKINKFLYQYSSDSLPRQSHANMVLIKALHMRPDPSQPAQECSLRVSLQPLRLNIDQDALFFLRKFFDELSDDQPPQPVPVAPEPVPIPPQTHKTTAPQPIMTVAPTDASEKPEDLVKFDEMLEALEEDEVLGEDVDRNEEPVMGEGEDESHQEQPIFFKSFIFSPDVPIRLDYHGKRVDMEQGTLAGLLVGLAHLNCSELRLKKLHQRHGLLGFKRLVLYTINEWLKDIKRNQLPSILGGVGPMHSLVQLVQGLRDLFWLPVEQFKKDGRIIRGLQRGAHSFATCTAMSALEITNRLVQTVQYCAEVAFDMVSPGPSVRKKKYRRRRIRRLTHPADLREGVSNAYNVVTEGFKNTAETIYHTALDEHEQKGVTGAVGSVLRQIPPSVLQPVIIATEATSNVLGGMRNQLLPDKKREEDEKWMPEEES